MGIDPVTHKPRIAIATNLSHMAQWEITRLEAEARFCHKPRLIPKSCQRVQNGSTPLVNKSPKPQCLDVLQAWRNITLSKQSYFKGSQTQVSTLSFFENALSSLSEFHNRSKLVTNPFEITEPSSVMNMNMNMNSCMSDWEIWKEPFNILNEQHTHETSDNILDQDNHTALTFTCPLTGNTNDGIHGDEYDDNADYWSQILDELRT